MKKLKWQIEIDEYLKTVSNDELLSSTIGMAGGDDYDGFFTIRGQYEFDAYYKELDKRLKLLGF